MALSVSFIAALIGLGFLFWAGLKPSDPGDNRFGAPASPLSALDFLKA